MVGDTDSNLCAYRSKAKCSEDYPACERCQNKRLLCLYTTVKGQSHCRNAIIEHDSSCTGARSDLGTALEISAVFGGTEDGGQLKNDDISLLNIDYLNENVTAGNRLDTGEPVAELMGTSPHQSIWPQATFSEFIGVGDFYPTLLSPSVWEGALEQSIPSFDTLPSVTTNTMQNAAGFATPPDFVLDTGGTALGYVPQPASSVLQGPPHSSMGNRRHMNPQSSKDDSANVTTGAPLGQVTMTATRTNLEPGPGNRLPALRDTLEPHRSRYPRRFFLPSVEPSTQDDLLTCLRLPLTRSPWQSMSLTSFPSGQQMDYFLDLYFGHFDMVRWFSRPNHRLLWLTHDT